LKPETLKLETLKLMRGQLPIECADCGRRVEVVGELPGAFRAAFGRLITNDGWMPRPGNADPRKIPLVCNRCAQKYEGEESRETARQPGGG
jgi:hypothetical protein